MKKLRFLSIMCLALVLMFTAMTPVFAKTTKIKPLPYYTNLNGVELTKVQYDNLARVFNEDTIATLTQDMANLLADDTTLTSSGKTTYVKTDTVYDYFESRIVKIAQENNALGED